MQTLRLFCDVALHRSFSEAAQLHGISQSAASQRVHHLEEQLGVTLIDRSVRPLALTEAGTIVLREGREIVQRYDALTQKLKPSDGTVRGEVIVDAIYSAGIDLLVNLREEFEKAHPGIKVRVDYKRPEQVHDRVRAGQCDLGIVSYPHRWKDVSVIPLRDERMSVVCSPRHALSARREVTAGDLAEQSMVTFESSLPVGRAIRRYLKEHGASPTITNMFDNIDTIKHAVSVTDDLTILPTRTVKREVEAGTLVSIRLEPELVRPMGVMSAKRTRSNGQALSPAAQVFVEFLLEHQSPIPVGEEQKIGHVPTPLPKREGLGEGGKQRSSETPEKTKQKRHRVNPEQSSRAQELRTQSTRPEQVLWNVLRNKQLGGLKFRQQHPVGPFITDFCCIKAKLIVEVDGESHVGKSDQDELRTQQIEQQGFRVVRVTNDDVLKHLDAVVEMIQQEAEQRLNSVPNQ